MRDDVRAAIGELRRSLIRVNLATMIALTISCAVIVKYC